MGKLIVLEGIDGSGKSTQFRLLCDRLRREGTDFTNVTFPRYDSESSALVRMYLGGAFGSGPDDVNAYAASSFYAVDRFASYKTEWGKQYESGGLILLDRYTTSNAVHQGAKLPEARRAEFFRWLRDYEYVKLGLPEPDAVIYLDVSAEEARRRRQERARLTGETGDIHEKDEEYLEQCARCAAHAAEELGWRTVPWQKNGAARSPGDIHEEIYGIAASVIRSQWDG